MASVRLSAFPAISHLALAALASSVFSVTASAATLRVCASGCTYTNLQSAIDAAQPGDTILLRAGQTFVGNYTLRDKGSSTAFITIRSDAADSSLPAAGVRLVPEGRSGANTARASLARLVGATGLKTTPLIRTAAGAHHYRLEFLDLDGAAMLGYETVIALGTDKADPDPPHHIVFDRVYLHGHRTKGQKRGIALNAKSIDVLNSYIADINAVDNDSQALAGWNGVGPFRIVNNYIAGGSENIMFGGARPATTGLIPSDIEISGNHILKNPAWRSAILSTPTSPRVSSTSASGRLAARTHYFKIVAVMRSAASNVVSGPSSEVSATVASGHGVTLAWSAVPNAESYRIYRGTSAGNESVYMTTPNSSTSFVYTGSAETSGTPRSSGTKWLCKNLIEFKNGQRVKIDHNLLENNWVDAQPGYAILFTPKNANNAAPWTAVRDITFTNNILRHTAGAFNILGYDDTVSGGSALTQRITIRNNLFYDIDPAKWGGNLAKFFQIGEGAADVVFDHNTVDHNTSVLLGPYGKPMVRFVFTNNIAQHGKYGVFGSGSSTGMPTITRYFPNAIFTYNVLAGGKASLYPPTNSFPTVAQWTASFVDPSSGDYRLLSSSVFYHAGQGGAVPGANVSTILNGASIDPAPAPAPPPSSATPPTADAGGPYTGQVLQDVTVSGARSTASGTTIASYTWEWADDVLIYASDFASSNLHGKWTRSSTSGAANGIALVNADAGAAKVSTPLASPSSYAEIKFQAAAGVPYYVWFRGRAQNNSYANDSFYIQFNDSENAGGSRLAQIGTTSALAMVLEEGNGAGLSGWGWNDANYGALASPIYFAASGTHTLRVQPREDGIVIDQIVISSKAYAAKRPGALKNDATILPGSFGTSQGVSAAHKYARAGVYPLLLSVKDQNGLGDTDTATLTVTGTSTSGLVANTDGPYTATASAQVVFDGSQSTGSIASSTWQFFDDIVLSGSALSSAQRHGSWKTLTDSTAASSIALADPNGGAAKVATALASPANYVDVTFTAAAGVPYRLWMRMRAANDSFSNDSVYVQFSDSVTSGGSAIYRTGTTSALAVVLEDGKGAGVSGWGWTDANYGGLGGPIYFSRSGAQTLRIQRREDGAIIDQIVLSSDKYYDDAPGAATSDKTLIPSTLGTATGTTVPHVYRWRGTYPLILRVKNSSGQSDTDTTTVSVK